MENEVNEDGYKKSKLSLEDLTNPKYSIAQQTFLDRVLAGNVWRAENPDKLKLNASAGGKKGGGKAWKKIIDNEPERHAKNASLGGKALMASDKGAEVRRKGARTAYENGNLGTQKMIACEKCGIVTNATLISRWHDNNCKWNQQMTEDRLKTLPEIFQLKDVEYLFKDIAAQYVQSYGIIDKYLERISRFKWKLKQS